MRRFFPFAVVLAWLALVPAPRAQLLYESYLEPGFVGNPNTEFSWWDVFYAANNSVANFPDLAAPFGGALNGQGVPIPVPRSEAGFPENPGYSPSNPAAFWDARNPTLKQTGTGAFIIGPGTAGNIYSFSEPIEFLLEDTTPYVAGTVVFQFETAGSTMDFAGIRLNYQTPSGLVSLAPNEMVKEYAGSGSAFGGISNRAAMQWDLTGLGVTSYSITFAASEASMSLQEVLLDTAQSPGTVVPKKRTWVGGATGNWTTSANWSGGETPQAGANVTFATGETVVLDESRAVGELILSGPGNVTIQSAVPAELTLNSGITAGGLDVGVHTINAPIVMGGLHYHDIAAAQTVVLNGNIRAGTFSDGVRVVGGIVKQGTGTLVVNGDIASSVAGSVQVADGTLVLAGTNRYSGLTSVRGGTLVIRNAAPLSAAGALGTNSTTIEIGAVLTDGTDTSPNVIPDTSRLLIDGNHTVGKNFRVIGGNERAVFGGTNTGAGARWAGSIQLAETNAVELHAESAADRVEFTGTLSGGSAARTLTKTGAGTVVFGGSNKTYLNQTVLGAGTLEIASGTAVTGNAPWQAAAGTTLRVNGTLGGTGTLALTNAKLTGNGVVARSATIDDGDRLAPGTDVGTLSFTGAQTWGGGGGYEWQLENASAAAGIGWDLVTITGPLNVTSTALNPFTIFVSGLALTGFDPGVDGTWIIATASAGITGFSQDKFAIDLTGWNAGGDFDVVQQGGALELQFTAVPEPGVFALLAVAAGLGLVAGRRRNRN